MSSEIKKVCVKCGNNLPISDFHKNKECRFGVSSLCKECSKIKQIQYCRTLDGKINQIYNSQKGNSTQRNRPHPNYTKKELKNWIISQPNYKTLFKEWEMSGYKKLMAPSCDRVDTLKPYTLHNLQLGTFKENHLHENIDMINGIIGKGKKVIGVNRTTGKIVYFATATEASRKLSIDKYSIAHCCRGRRKSAGNYTWRYVA